MEDLQKFLKDSVLDLVGTTQQQTLEVELIVKGKKFVTSKVLKSLMVIAARGIEILEQLVEIQIQVTGSKSGKEHVLMVKENHGALTNIHQLVS